MSYDLNRRQFIKQGAMLGAAVAIGLSGAAGGAEADGVAQPAAPAMPIITLGKLEVSRLILGSNPFFGFAHKGGDTAARMKEFYTEAKIMSVLDEAAANGITAVASPPYGHWIKLWAKYQEAGGKLKIWIAQPDAGAAAMKNDLDAAVKGGAKAIFIQGERVDAQFTSNKFDMVRDWIDYIHTHGLPAGMGSHRPDVHLEAQKREFPNDFFYQCFYRGDSFLAADRDKAVDTLAKLEKPVIGYKVLAAGRNTPEEGIGFAMKHLRKKDGMCIGVFPKDEPNQIAINARLVTKLSAATQPA